MHEIVMELFYYKLYLIMNMFIWQISNKFSVTIFDL